MELPWLCCKFSKVKDKDKTKTGGNQSSRIIKKVAVFRNRIIKNKNFCEHSNQAENNCSLQF
jgi:hypothetical protein